MKSTDVSHVLGYATQQAHAAAALGPLKRSALFSVSLIILEPVMIMFLFFDRAEPQLRVAAAVLAIALANAQQVVEARGRISLPTLVWGWLFTSAVFAAMLVSEANLWRANGSISLGQVRLLGALCLATSAGLGMIRAMGFACGKWIAPFADK